MRDLALTLFASGLFTISFAGQVAASDPAPWKTRQGDGFQVETPADWRYVGPADMDRENTGFNGKADVGYFMITPGKDRFRWDCFIGMGRTGDESQVRRLIAAAAEKTAVVVAGERATRYAFHQKDLTTPWRGYLIMFDKPHGDGKQVGLIFASASAKWNDYLPVFNRVLKTLKLDSAAAKPGATIEGRVTTNGGKPAAGVTVLIGRNLRLKQDATDADSTDLLIGDVLYAKLTTSDSGAYRWTPPVTADYSVIFWKRLHTPVIYESVKMPPAVNTRILRDESPGGTGRHLRLDTSRVPFDPAGKPPATPPADGLKPIDGVFGRITENGKPVARVRVFIGENLNIKTGRGSTDELVGDALFASVETNDKGGFAVPLPPGFYSVVWWKQGYAPAVYESISVPPGRVVGNLLPDGAVGAGGRHMSIDISSVPRDTPLGKSGETGVRGRVFSSKTGRRSPLDKATILIGRNLGLFAHDPTGQSPVDIAFGAALFATSQTDDRGRFLAPLPPGAYDLIVWKERHIPQHNIRVYVPKLDPECEPIRQAKDAGVWNTTLSYDDQPGGTGRHLRLDTKRLDGRKVAAKPGECPLVGKVRLSSRGLRTAGAGVRVIVAPLLSVTGGREIVVEGRGVQSAVTDEQGRFDLSLKPGSYHILFWKAGYRLDGPHAISLPEQGELNRTLLSDSSAGAATSLRIKDHAGVSKPAPPPKTTTQHCPRCQVVTKTRDTPLCTRCVAIVNGDYAMQRHAQRQGQKRKPREQPFWRYLPKSALRD